MCAGGSGENILVKQKSIACWGFTACLTLLPPSGHTLFYDDIMGRGMGAVCCREEGLKVSSLSDCPVAFEAMSSWDGSQKKKNGTI